MSKPKQPMTFLKNRFTGVIFPHTEKLAKNADLVPCNEDGSDLFGEAPEAPTAPSVPDPSVNAENVLNSPDADTGADTDTGDAGQGEGEGESETGEGDDAPAPVMIGEKTLEKASKAEIIAFVKTATGVQIEDSLKVADVREQAEQLLRSA